MGECAGSQETTVESADSRRTIRRRQRRGGLVTERFERYRRRWAIDEGCWDGGQSFVWCRAPSPFSQCQRPTQRRRARAPEPVRATKPPHLRGSQQQHRDAHLRLTQSLHGRWPSSLPFELLSRVGLWTDWWRIEFTSESTELPNSGHAKRTFVLARRSREHEEEESGGGGFG